MDIIRLQATPPMSPRHSYGYGRHLGLLSLLGHLEVTLKPSLGVLLQLVMCAQVQEGLKAGTS